MRRHIITLFKNLALQYFLLIALLTGVSSTNSYARNTVAKPARELEQDMSDFSNTLKTLSTDSLYKLGNTYLSADTPRYDYALLCYITAQNRLKKETGNKKAVAVIVRSYVNTAYIYNKTYRDFSEAYINLHKAQKICNENNLDSLLAYVQHSLAVLRYDDNLILSKTTVNSTDNDLYTYFRNAFDTARKQNMYRVMSYSLYNFLESSRTKSDTIKALEMADIYLSSDIPGGNTMKQYITNMCHGVKYFSSGDYEKAIEAYGKMVPKGFPMKKDSVIMANQRDNLIAKAYEGMGDFQKSRKILLDILERVTKDGDIESQQEYHRRLYLLLLKMNDDEEAVKHLVKYYKAKEKILSMADNGSSMAEIEMKQSIKEYENSLLAARIKEKQDRIIIICISIAALCAVTALILTVYYYRKRRHYIMELYKKNQNQMKSDDDRLRADLGDNNDSTEICNEPVTVSESSEIIVSSFEKPEVMSKNSDSFHTRTKTELELIRKIEDILGHDSSVFDPDYQMSRLCSQVGSNPTYVSRAINAHFGKNFKTVLTERRVREACRRLDDPTCSATLTIEAICQEVGFRSRTAFASAFKNITGLTPSEYRQAARKYTP